MLQSRAHAHTCTHSQAAAAKLQTHRRGCEPRMHGECTHPVSSFCQAPAIPKHRRVCSFPAVSPQPGSPHSLLCRLNVHSSLTPWLRAALCGALSDRSPHWKPSRPSSPQPSTNSQLLGMLHPNPAPEHTQLSPITLYPVATLPEVSTTQDYTREAS